MAAKVLYTAKGTDPSTVTWPSTGPPKERWTFSSGVPVVIPELIGYGNGNITFADGRQFPVMSQQGSTMVHQKG
jgi:hypothetical protein